MKTIPTVGVIVVDSTKEKILLVCHGEAAEHLTDTWGLPAGRLEEDESKEERAVLELEEETGLTTTLDDLIKLPLYYETELERKSGRKKFSLEVFYCKKYAGKLAKTSETEPSWIALDSLEELNFVADNSIEIIEQSVKFLKDEGII